MCFIKEPSKTNFQVVSTYEDGFNITWSTSDQMNAASLFYVKYKKTDDTASPWLRTALTTDNYLAITDLDRGTRYSVVLVATTGTENVNLETESNVETLKTAGQGKPSLSIIIITIIILFVNYSNGKLLISI